MCWAPESRCELMNNITKSMTDRELCLSTREQMIILPIDTNFLTQIGLSKLNCYEKACDFGIDFYRDHSVG